MAVFGFRSDKSKYNLGNETDLPNGQTSIIGAIKALFEKIWGVANGGTGKSTLTSNAVLTGNGTSSVKEVATASGAMFATQANGAAQFGTLPVAQGGTGATNAATALTNLGAAAASHTHNASNISGGTFGGDVKAPASTDYSTAKVININVVSTEPTEGASSPYVNGTITFVKA